MTQKAYPIHKNVIKRLTKEVACELYEKLIEIKTQTQNRPSASKEALSRLGNEKGGDEADQVSRLQEEVEHTGRIQRDNKLLEEILQALARMEKGSYGICEYTGENIREKRLRSLPYTRLSFKGAEELMVTTKAAGYAR